MANQQPAHQPVRFLGIPFLTVGSSGAEEAVVVVISNTGNLQWRLRGSGGGNSTAAVTSKWSRDLPKTLYCGNQPQFSSVPAAALEVVEYIELNPR